MANVIAIIALIFSLILAAFAVLVFLKSRKIDEALKQSQRAQLFLQIRLDLKDVSERKSNRKMAYEKNPTDDKLVAWATAIENYLGAYDDACAQYLEGNIDGAKFKKIYASEIKGIMSVSKTVYVEFFKYGNGGSSYPNIVTVAREWFSKAERRATPRQEYSEDPQQGYAEEPQQQGYAGEPQQGYGGEPQQGYGEE